MGRALTLGTKIIQILGSYIRDRREYLLMLMYFSLLKYHNKYGQYWKRNINSKHQLTLLRSVFLAANSY